MKHAFLRISLCKNLLAVDGTPLITLKEFINVATPTSEAALNGGKIVLYRV